MPTEQISPPVPVATHPLLFPDSILHCGLRASHTRSPCCCRPWKQTVQADPELREEGDGQWPVLRCSNKMSRQPLTLISLKNATVIRNLYCFTRRQSQSVLACIGFSTRSGSHPPCAHPNPRYLGSRRTPLCPAPGPGSVGFGNTALEEDSMFSVSVPSSFCCLGFCTGARSKGVNAWQVVLSGLTHAIHSSCTCVRL